MNKKINSYEYNLNEDNSINKEIEGIITNIENELCSNEQNNNFKNIDNSESINLIKVNNNIDIDNISKEEEKSEYSNSSHIENFDVYKGNNSVK